VLALTQVRTNALIRDQSENRALDQLSALRLLALTQVRANALIRV
jgi:hypothetical protein